SRPDARAVASALTHRPMAVVTAFFGEETLAVLGIAGVCSLRIRRNSGGQQERGADKQKPRAHISPYRGCETTSRRAGSPRFTTWIVLLRAGPRSLVLVMGRALYTP